jgi:two-component system, chemotaxis family, chemotaxis protein CheY
VNDGAVILVVDDDEAILDIVQWALEDEGYEVRRATDGSEALGILSTLRPALILLDMRMPGMNGWEFAEAYRAFDGRRAPVIVMTAAQDACPLAAEIGADGCIGKPFDVDQLIGTVRQRIPMRTD